MFCVKCGAPIANNALFCTNCGARVETPVFNNVSTQTQPKTEIKKFALPIGIVAGVVAVIIIIAIIASSFSGGGYIKTLDNYYKAHENHDADLMYESVIAQYWIDYKNEGWGNSAYESIEDSIEDSIDDWGCGNNIEITYEVISEKRANKEQLEELEDNLYDWYAYYVYDRDEFSITDAYVLDIDFIVEGNKRTDSFHYPDGLLIIKENGKWRIPRGAVNCSFYSNQ